MLICLVCWVSSIFTNLCIVDAGEDHCLSLRFRQGDKRKQAEKEMDGPDVAFTLPSAGKRPETIPRLAADLQWHDLLQQASPALQGLPQLSKVSVLCCLALPPGLSESWCVAEIGGTCLASHGIWFPLSAAYAALFPALGVDGIVIMVVSIINDSSYGNELSLVFWL